MLHVLTITGAARALGVLARDVRDLVRRGVLDDVVISTALPGERERGGMRAR
jgi:hypothetical protein